LPPVSTQNREEIAAQFLTADANDEYLPLQRGCCCRRWLQHLQSPSLKKHAGTHPQALGDVVCALGNLKVDFGMRH